MSLQSVNSKTHKEFCLAVILSASVDLQGHTVWQLAMEQLEATCWLDRSWRVFLLKNLWHCKRTDERKKKTWFIFQFEFRVWLLLDNHSFPFLFLFHQLSNPCLLLYTVTESLCQVFHGTISINCGWFYSVGWHCLTLLTTNCSASNAVWGLPAWNPTG